MDDKYVKVQMIFYNNRQYARKTPPFLRDEKYYPHFVIKGENTYLGVCFIEGEDVILGQVVSGIAKLIYDVDYSKLIVGANFFIMEGPNKVGAGKVLERWGPTPYK